VADITTTFKVGRRFITSFRSPKSTSVASVRSWASSKITTLYLSSSGSDIAWRSNMPSVKKFKIVSGDVLSSNRMRYPTYDASSTSSSSATRCATLMAATRRGWVQAMPRFWPSWIW